MTSDGRTLLLLDVSALVYRAFFALPPLTTRDGQPANAVYGFERMLNRVLIDERPTHVVACLDAGIPAERLEAAPEYKANRPPTPDDLASQFPLVDRVLAAHGITSVEVEGEEADDCIATLSTRASRQGVRTVIVSGDLDLLQLVDKNVTVVVTRRGITDMARYDEAAVRERFGLAPSQLPDYRGLKGDPSDNLPGVPGIGEKTAAKLIAQYGSLDALLERADQVTPKRIADLLVRYADQARACRDVSTAKRDLPIELRLEDCGLRADVSARNALFKELGFGSLVSVPPPKGDATPSSIVQERPVRSFTHALISDRAGALAVIARAREADSFALAAVPELRTWRDPEPVGFALAAVNAAAALPSALMLADPVVRAAFAELLAAVPSRAAVHGAKAFAGWLAARDLSLAEVGFDSQLAHGLLDGRVDPTLADTLAFAGSDAGYVPLASSSKDMGLFAEPPALQAAHASAAAALLTAADNLRTRVDDAGMDALLRDVEQPLALVLAAMERAGFRLDLDELVRIRAHLERVMAQSSASIYALAGGEFNINSPKALGEVLFEKLGLQHAGTTKTGYATGAEVLAPLATEHEIVSLVLEYREVSKLKSTYVDALPTLIDRDSGRLHTTLHQLGAATGRLSSSDPNLQNIPIRSATGREIRRAFLAPTPGNVLLAADYSQIELRLLAHMADDPNLIDAFNRGEDIHEYTARAVFGIAPDAPIDAEMRRRAKAVNFGILYGQGEVGLAQSVGFSRAEARDFIAAYFARFPRVRGYIDTALTRARADGFVTTLTGRRRTLPDLAARNWGLRAAAERMAMNAPLQGSAADLIKIAMLRVAGRLREREPSAQLVLQVHDELIFDVPPDRVAQVRAIADEAMTHAMELRVPLVVEFKAGSTWGEA